MLVLSRQRDQSIMIGDGIEITVVDIRAEKVRLGIKAPLEIPVHRKEIYDAQKDSKDGAVTSLAKGKGTLVLSRAVDQVIMIGDDIEIMVVDIRGEKVRLGTTAPSSVAIHRREVFDSIKKSDGENVPVKSLATDPSDGKAV